MEQKETNHGLTRHLTPARLTAIIGIGIILPILITGVLFYFAEKKKPVEFGEFLSLSGGVQSIIALFTFVVTAMAAHAIFQSQRQLKLQVDQMELETQQMQIEIDQMQIEQYRRLISPEMHSTKKFLHNSDVEKLMQNLRKSLMGKNPDYAKLLNELRTSVDAVGSGVTMPLLPDIKIGFDHIESLINEYNFLCKLLLEKRLDPKFATDLGLDNFPTVYKLVEPVIELRKAKAPKYANHFSEWCRLKSSIGQ